MKFVTLSAIIVTLTGCTTIGSCPKLPAVEKPTYAIYDLPDNATCPEKARAGAISFKQCVSYATQLSNVQEKLR